MVLSFGPYRLVPAERLLQRDNEPVALGSRALDILIALAEHAPNVISQRDLIGRVWPDLIVEEGNLRVHIANLRNVLGNGRNGAPYIANVPRCGYCFVAPVQRISGVKLPSPDMPRKDVPASRSNLPVQLPGIVGREETIQTLSKSLASRRFVSIVGSAGVGKTTVAVAVAHAMLDEFGSQVVFVDLGAISDIALVPDLIACVLGLVPQLDEQFSRLASFLEGKRLLLVLDNCEHVINSVAAFVERVFRQAPQIYLLTTSRESLRVEGETVYLLPPLDNPPLVANLTAAEAIDWPAVQLFMERAAAGGYRFALTDEDAPVVADICRRLDGVALAIELVASRVGTFGIRGTADLLDSRFKLLWQGRRSALPRHQTLSAMLDWSFNSLSERDRRVLCRLSIFAGLFTVEAAQRIAADNEIASVGVADAITSLVNKSLVWASPFDGVSYHRLPDTTRSYAAIKLSELGEANNVARQHALHFRNSLELDLTMFGSQESAGYIAHLGNITAALDWSFSVLGERAVAVDLAARSVVLFLGLSLLTECQRWCEQGLDGLASFDRGSKKELALQGGLAVSVMFTHGNSPKVRLAIERGLQLAETLGEKWHQLKLLAWLHIFLTDLGDCRGAGLVAQRSIAVARKMGDIRALAISDWMLGCAYHFAGDQELAQRYCETGFKRASSSIAIQTDPFGYDHRISALVVLARTRWLRGFSDQADRLARQAIDEAERRGYPVTLCISLIYSATVSLWRGDLDIAEKRIERLVALSATHLLRPYERVGMGLSGDLAIQQGRYAEGIEMLRGALDTLQGEHHHLMDPSLARTLAAGLVRCGHTEEATAIVDGLLDRSEIRGEVPELLRMRGIILLSQSQPDVPAAEQVYLLSLQCARDQSALAWELRTATELARLWRTIGRVDQAKDLISKTCQRFTEGFDTADIKVALELLEEMR